MKVSRARFERLVESALKGIPQLFRGLIVNLEISVQGLPGPEAGRWQGSRNLLGAL